MQREGSAVGHVVNGVELKSLYLIVSDGCNINCSYCYKKNSKNKNGLMSEQIAMDAVDFVLNRLDADDMKLTIFFWGGEPFLNLKVIKRVIAEYPQMQFNSNTNGELINEELYNYLKSMSNFNITVSMGSGEERYGTFKAYLEAEKMQWAIKLAVDRSVNFVANNPHKLFENVQLIYDRGIRNILIDIPTGNTWVEEDYAVFEEQFFELMKKFQLDTFNNNIFKNNLWLETFGPAERIKPKGARFCNTGMQRILVDPKGNIWQCDNFYIRQYNQLGDIYNGIDYTKLDYLKEYAEDITKTKKYCEGCEIYFYCPRNKCLGLNWELTGDIMKPDASWCRANKSWINITKKYIAYKGELDGNRLSCN